MKLNLNKVIIYSSFFGGWLCLLLCLRYCFIYPYKNLSICKPSLLEKIMQKLLPKSLFLKRSKMQQLTAFLFLNSPLNTPTVHKGFPWFPVVLYLLKLRAQSSRAAAPSEVFFRFYLIACLYKHDLIQETFQMKGKGTKFYLFHVLLHGSCTYFFFKHKRLQPFKLQSNCHPGKRSWFIFLKLKIMFTNGNNCRAPF